MMKNRGAKKIFSLAMAVGAVFFIFSCGGNPSDNDNDGTVCGNGLCEKGEDSILLTDPVQFKCAPDCKGTCGDGVCNTCYENKDNCPQDCSE